MGRIRPQFNSRMPKNAAYFFDPASDENFKARHPIGYGVLVVVGITAFMLPLVIFIVLTELYSPTHDNGWGILGIIGCFIIGVGLFNIVAAWIKQYLGHWVTIASFVIGGLLVGLSCLFLFNGQLSASFDEDMVINYFVTMLLILVPGLIYMLFRSDMKNWIKHHAHKTVLKNREKGWKNFWWYADIQAAAGLGWRYLLNKTFIIIYSATLAVHILLGWIKPVTVAVMAGSAAVYVIAGIMLLISRIEYNREYHGRPFVLSARSVNGGIDSVILDMMALIFPLACGFAQFRLLMNVFDISF